MVTKNKIIPTKAKKDTLSSKKEIFGASSNNAESEESNTLKTQTHGLSNKKQAGLERFWKSTEKKGGVKKTQTGIKGFDETLEGGIPEGRATLITGNTGAGKTTLAMHFIKNGLDNNENCVWVALEEPIPQIKKTALEHELNLEEYEKNGQLKFVTVPLIDVSPDQLLYRILDAVTDTGTKRVVIDSVSSLQSATMDENKVREFLIQISGFFKTLGVTCVMNYLVSDAFGATKDQLLAGLMTNEMRLSSSVDAIIILRYVERGQNVHKLLNVLKVRGSQHSKDIFRYELGKEGFIMGDKFEI